MYRIQGTEQEREVRRVPKLKPTTEETENRIVVWIIEKYQTIQDFLEEEIRMICKVLKIPNWEKVQMI